MIAAPVTNELANPASVFISYARNDEATVLPLERALQERGVRVLRDKPSLPLGALNVAGLRHMIDAECDAILCFATHSFLRSDFIWRHEVPAALARHQWDPRFHIIPVLHSIDYSALALACADRGLPSIADFNAERVAGAELGAGDTARIARRTLGAALAMRLGRDEGPPDALGLCLRTFPFTPPTPRLHLDLDWTAAFAGAGPSPEDWRDRLLPALADVADALARHHRGLPVEAWLKARLPAAIALGHAFPAKGAVALRLRTEHDAWPSNGPGAAAEDLLVTGTALGKGEPSAIVEVAISREIAPAVTRWREAVGLLPGWRVRCAPAGGPARDAITGAAQARGWARRIGDELRRLWDREGVHEAHLFVASSAEFAALVGQQLRDRRPVHVYYGDNEAGYRRAYTLGGA